MFSKTRIVAVLATLTFAAALTATGGEAQAGGSGWGVGLGVGIATGAMIGAAAASNGYYGPAYVVGPAYRECRYVARYDAFGNYIRTVKVCDVVPY
jgi:hypothetical protein